MAKKIVTFIQIGNYPEIPIPFWLYVAILRTKTTYWAIKLWVLRRLGIVYDPDNAVSECPYCHEKYKGTYGNHVLRKAHNDKR